MGTPKEDFDAQNKLINQERVDNSPEDEKTEMEAIADDAENIMEENETKTLDQNVGDVKEAIGSSPAN